MEDSIHGLLLVRFGHDLVSRMAIAWSCQRGLRIGSEPYPLIVDFHLFFSQLGLPATGSPPEKGGGRVRGRRRSGIDLVGVSARVGLMFSLGDQFYGILVTITVPDLCLAYF